MNGGAAVIPEPGDKVGGEQGQKRIERQEVAHELDEGGRVVDESHRHINDGQQVLGAVLANQFIGCEAETGEASNAERNAKSPNHDVVQRKEEGARGPLLNPRLVCQPADGLLLLRHVAHPAREEGKVPEAWAREGHGLRDTEEQRGREDHGEQADQRLLQGAARVALL